MNRTSRAIDTRMQTVGVGNRAELGGTAGICIDSYDELDPEAWPLLPYSMRQERNECNK